MNLDSDTSMKNSKAYCNCGAKVLSFLKLFEMLVPKMGFEGH